MTTFFLTQIPREAQLALIFAYGAVLAALANYCVDRLGWNERFRSPWRRLPKEYELSLSFKRSWIDRVPIVGWFFLRRFGNSASRSNEKNVGNLPGCESCYFWIRPLVVEILFALLIIWRFKYWTILFDDLGTIELADNVVTWRFFAAWGVETILFWLALCSSLIDLDDYVIPDGLVLPGTIGALVFSVAFPFLSAPINWPLNFEGGDATLSVKLFVGNILATNGVAATPTNILVFLGVVFTIAWTFWAFAILDRRFYLRLGLKRAIAIFVRRIRRSSLTSVVLIVWALGVVALWSFLFLEGRTDESHTVLMSVDALASSFVGLLTGMIVIWAVRLIGGSALGVEAMGFGDVILMGMLGAFIGWQGAIVVFFVAPFFGLVFGLLRRCVNSAPEIPYGPFLCLATLVYIIYREQIDIALTPYFSDPLFVFFLGLVGFVLLAAALWLLRFFKSLRRSS